ncbi:MAG: TIGR01212 family radical SAM protein [Thermosulfidibacteraceae bacterium]|jgi:radical SAM protein (TIGR01212 family)
MNRRYNSLSNFLKRKFGEPVRKIMLDAGLTCPNRDGIKGTGGCIYCNWKGSGTGLKSMGYSLKEQIDMQVGRLASRGYRKFIAYFQSFSNTYAPIDVLDSLYSVVLDVPCIVAMAIGTRPDCINEEVIKLLKKYKEKGYLVWVELGLQSVHDETLRFINRGHTFQDFLVAYELLKRNDFDVVVHIIFGLPGETFEMQMETVRTISGIKVDGVKFHVLYVLKGTPLGDIFERGIYIPMDLEDYVNTVVSALELLPPATVIHRLVSETSSSDLLAPLWIKDKRYVIRRIEEELKEKDSYQGKYYGT